MQLRTNPRLATPSGTQSESSQNQFARLASSQSSPSNGARRQTLPDASAAPHASSRRCGQSDWDKSQKDESRLDRDRPAKTQRRPELADLIARIRSFGAALGHFGAALRITRVTLGSLWDHDVGMFFLGGGGRCWVTLGSLRGHFKATFGWVGRLARMHFPLRS